MAGAAAVRRASLGDLDALVPLFDAYRTFYGQPADPDRARSFLRDRLVQDQSIIIVAEDVGRAVGFTQLYPSFSSASTARIFILNDLYVVPDARRTGAAITLLDHAAAVARGEGAIRLTLSTAVDNAVAQATYARAGWQRDDRFYVFNLNLVV